MLLIRSAMVTFFARSANLRVEIVSKALEIEGEMVAMRHVLVFPPKESVKRRVKTDSRYGT